MLYSFLGGISVGIIKLLPSIHTVENHSEGCCINLRTHPARQFMGKGIVQRDVRGVKSRLKRSVMINCLVALFIFLVKGTPLQEK